MKNLAKSLLAIVFCIGIFNVLFAKTSENQVSFEKKLTNTRWIYCNETEGRKKCITLEFVSESQCVFIIEEQLEGKEQFHQPSPRCDYKYQYPNITFTNGLFFDSDKKFYRPKRGYYFEEGIRMELEDGNILEFAPLTK